MGASMAGVVRLGAMGQMALIPTVRNKLTAVVQALARGRVKVDLLPHQLVG